MIRTLLAKLGEQTSVAIVLRKIVELNFRKEKAAIREYVNLSPDARIVDVGCGTGEFAPLFRTEGYTGIDIDPSNIAYAKRHYPGYRFDVGDALALPFDDASFDVALVVGVLHHLSIEDCRRALAEIVRVVKPNAKALIMEDTESTRLVTRTMHNLDQGAFIRSKAEWTSMMEEFFTIEYSWTFDSGVCFYSGFVLRRK